MVASCFGFVENVFLYHMEWYFYFMYAIIRKNVGDEKMLCYCDKCGNISDWSKPEEHKCYCCQNLPLKPIPREYIDNFRWRDGDGKQAFIEEVVKKSPNLDAYLFEHKDEIIKAQNDDMNAKMAIGRAALNERSNKAKCPTCGSNNLKKISGTSKIASVAMWGLLSQKVRKQFHCDNCGYEW